jgi:hypothetical protein
VNRDYDDDLHLLTIRDPHNRNEVSGYIFWRDVDPKEMKKWVKVDPKTTEAFIEADLKVISKFYFLNSHH